MTGHPLSKITEKLSMHPELVAGQGCSVALLQNFLGDPAASIIISIDVDLSIPQSGAWQLYRLLTGKEVDRDK